MPPADLLTGTRPLGYVEAPTPTTAIGNARQDSFSRLTQIELGKELQASILSRLSDGTFLVRVADTVARMNLPVGTKAGDSMPMVLISKDPRPTFQIGNQANGPATALTTALPPTTTLTTALATTGDLIDNFLDIEKGPSVGGTALGKAPPVVEANATATAQIATALPSGATTSLSAAGRLIDQAIHAAQQEGMTNTVVGRAPLVETAASTTTQVANALRDSLTYSGVFYESHVAQWATGHRAVAELKREPQMQPENMLPDTTRLKSAADLNSNIATAATAQTPTEADALPRAETLSTEASRLINLQLTALEQRTVQWQGELWPGQPLEWEVSEQPPESDAENAPSTWQSVVRFELPTLGVVSATIRLAGGRVQMQVQTASEATAVSLRAHHAELASAMEAAGAPLDLLTVKQDDTP